MKKLLLSILLLLSFSGSAFGAGTCWNGGSSGTTPWSVLDGAGGAPSAEYADVNYCVNTVAAAGDTVLVGADTATWTTRLTITKGITLTGAGTASTIITASGLSGSQLMRYEPAVPADDPRVDISGFTLDGGLSTGGFYVGNRGHADAPVRNWRFHGNVVRHTRNHAINIYGSAWGLIDNNRFHDASANGGGYVFYIRGDDEATWSTEPATPDYGTVNWLYIENNLLDSNAYIMSDTGEGSKWIARFNTICTGTSADGCGTDSVASQPQNVWNVHTPTANAGSYAVELYNNLLTPSKSYYRFGYIGASIIGFNNKINTSSTSTVAFKFYSRSDCYRELNDSYVWNNRRISNDYIMAPGSSTCATQDTDFWTDGNYGVGQALCGEGPCRTDPIGAGNFYYDVASKRPAATCTVDDAYFETDTFPNSNGGKGALYNCTSTNTWTKVYEPFTCPHPLAGTGTCDYTTAGQAGYSLGAGPTYYLLTVSKAGDGSGVVTSSPAGINCSTGCTEQYVDGTSVVLTSTVAGNNQFDGWSGEGCSGTSTCTVTMSAAKGVTATYTDTTPTNFLVTITYAGSGTGATTPAIALSPKAYASGATPTITQVAGSNSTFTGWSGTCSSCTGTGDCTPTITADCSVIATWASDGQYSITIAYPYNGETVESDVVSLTCGGDERICTRTFDPGDIVLTTTCATGWYGATWSGDDSGADPITISLGAANIALVVSCTNGYGVTLGSGGSATLGSGGTATVYR